jgi:predicted phage tail protein
MKRQIKVKLLGELGRKFGREYSFYVHNSKQVLSALGYQIDGFKEYLYTAHEKGMGFKLITKDPQGMDYDGLDLACDRLIIAPVIAGSGGNAGKILLGAALIGLAFIPGVGTAAAAAGSAGIFGTGVAFTTVGSLMFSLGASLLLGVLAALLAPPVATPKGDSKKKESFMFDRAAELTSQGYPVPIIYGQFLAQAPLVISSSISTTQVNV